MSEESNNKIPDFVRETLLRESSLLGPSKAIDIQAAEEFSKMMKTRLQGIQASQALTDELETPKPSANVFIIEPYKSAGHYDEVHKQVVRANTEAEARMFASENAKDEGRQVWLDPTESSCKPLKRSGDLGVICEEGSNG